MTNHDVSCAIEVAVAAEVTRSTGKCLAAPELGVDLTTLATRLAGELLSCLDHAHSWKALGLVLEIGTEAEMAPCAHSFSGLRAKSPVTVLAFDHLLGLEQRYQDRLKRSQQPLYELVMQLID